MGWMMLKVFKNTNSIFIGVFELAEYSGEKGCSLLGRNIGGEIQKDDVKYISPKQLILQE